MQNHEYGLAIPLARLYHGAVHHRVECRTAADDEPPQWALQSVREMLCPCIRGDACVCRALAREFQAHTRHTRERRETDGEMDAT